MKGGHAFKSSAFLLFLSLLLCPEFFHNRQETSVTSSTTSWLFFGDGIGEIIEKSLIFILDTTATLKNPVSLDFLVNTDLRICNQEPLFLENNWAVHASLGCDINNNGSHFLGPLLHSNNGAWKYKHRKPKRSQSWSPYYPNSTACRQILLLGGDISCNPGPVTTQVSKMKTKSQQKRTTNKCPKCEKLVQRNHKRLECENCFDLVHIRCADVNSWFVKNTIAKEPRSWICPNCTLAQLPFYSAVDISSLTIDLTETTGLTQDPQVEKRSHLKLLATRLPTNKSHLKAAHINVNGLLTKAKLQEVQILLETTEFDLLGITETKLTSRVEDKEIDIPGYKFLRRDRPAEDGGGGIVLYYIDTLDVVERSNLFSDKLNTLEAIWVEVILHSQRLVLSIMYRPPNDADFFSVLEKQLDSVCGKRKNIMIMGDLNSNLLNARGCGNTLQANNSTDHGRKLVSVLRKFGLVNVIKQPTRITETSSTLIDLSIVSNRKKVVISGVFDTGIADHRLIYTSLKLTKARVPPTIRSVIDWKNCDKEAFKEQVALAPWHACNVFEDSDDNCWMTNVLYQDIKREFLSERKAKIRTNSLPWMNGDIRKIMNQRYKQLRKAQKTGDPDDWKRYKDLRNKVSVALKRAEAAYWKKSLCEAKRGSSSFWKIVRQMTKRDKNYSKRIGPLRDEDSMLISDDLKKSTFMNSFFATVGEKLASSFPPTTVDMAYITRITPTLSDVGIDCEEFYNKLKKVNTRKAHGSDGITPKEMQIIAREISYSIANMSRMSYDEGKYPQDWKIGKVKVLHKSGDKDNCGNYRPLTMLSIPSKITESIICDTIDPHLNEVLQKNQWGYRKGLSSESLLLYLTETWKQKMDEGKVVGAIFIDFRKAFDSVSHDILYYKMHACGLSGKLLCWLKSYLLSRWQFVDLNGFKSPLLEVKYGVPQGSLLGPRLFSIYVNDFSESISKGELHLYADDTTAFVIGNSTDEVVVKLNLLFEEIHTWCQHYKLTLHTGKTEVMILQKNAFVGPLPPIKCGGNLIEYSNKSKVLGVLLDHRLSWREHVNDVIKSLSRQLCVLKSMRYLSSQLLEEIYFKTIIPQITYCIGVWGSCSGSMFAEIERLHVKAGRTIHKIPRNVSDFDVLDLIKWQDLGYLYKRRLAIEAFKVKEDLNNRLSSFVNFSKSMRKGPLLEIKRVKSETGRNSFLFRAPIVWNSLDSRSRFSEELDVFKAELKRNKKQLKKVSFSRGTITNSNKDLGNFIYF